MRFVAPELIMQTLASSAKVRRFGVRELERVVFDMFAESLADARISGAVGAVWRSVRTVNLRFPPASEYQSR